MAKKPTTIADASTVELLDEAARRLERDRLTSRNLALGLIKVQDALAYVRRHEDAKGETR